MLDDDSVAPKLKIQAAIEHIREEQQKIARIQAEAQAMQQRAGQFLMEDPQAQASRIAGAQGGVAEGAGEDMAAEAVEEGEEDIETVEDNPDDN